MHALIYENGVKEFAPYHPYFTLISPLLKAASKPCKGAKYRERTAMKRSLRGEEEKNFYIDFYIVAFGVWIEKNARLGCS